MRWRRCRAGREHTDLDDDRGPYGSSDSRTNSDGHRRALLDLETLEYSVSRRPERLDIAWSPDYRYAARGFAGGHGGLCG